MFKSLEAFTSFRRTVLKVRLDTIRFLVLYIDFADASAKTRRNWRECVNTLSSMKSLRGLALEVSRSHVSSIRRPIMEKELEEKLKDIGRELEFFRLESPSLNIYPNDYTMTL